MIIPERKRAVGVILSKFNKHGESEHLSDGGKVEKSEMPDMSAKNAHMQELIASIHNKDHEGAVSALNSFLSEHELHQEKEDSPSDYSPED